MSLYCRLSERVPAQHTTTGRVAVESALVGLGVVAADLCVDVGVTVLEVGRELHVVLAFLAAAWTAAGFGHTAGRIAGNRRAAWLIPALALYSMDVVPDTAFPVMHPAETGAPSLGLLVDCATVAVLLVRRCGHRAGPGAGWPWAIAVVGALVGLPRPASGGRGRGRVSTVSAAPARRTSPSCSGGASCRRRWWSRATGRRAPAVAGGPGLRRHRRRARVPDRRRRVQRRRARCSGPCACSGCSSSCSAWPSCCGGR